MLLAVMWTYTRNKLSYLSFGFILTLSHAGGMTNAPAFVDERSIYYKHADANFFSAYPFIIGKAISKVPQVRTR